MPGLFSISDVQNPKYLWFFVCVVVVVVVVVVISYFTSCCSTLLWPLEGKVV